MKPTLKKKIVAPSQVAAQASSISQQDLFVLQAAYSDARTASENAAKASLLVELRQRQFAAEKARIEAAYGLSSVDEVSMSTGAITRKPVPPPARAPEKSAEEAPAKAPEKPPES